MLFKGILGLNDRLQWSGFRFPLLKHSLSRVKFRFVQVSMSKCVEDNQKKLEVSVTQFKHEVICVKYVCEGSIHTKQLSEPK